MATKRRIIEKVPPALIGLLEAAGRLPLLPDAVRSIESTSSSRNAMLSEITALVWIAQWHGDRIDDTLGFRAPVGIAAYRDVYDYCSGRDIREIIHVVGTPRSIVDLIAWMHEDAGKRPLTGSVNFDNDDMNDFLLHFGAKETRVVWELAPCLS